MTKVTAAIDAPTFQHPSTAMHVTVRSVDLSSRVAFGQHRFRRRHGDDVGQYNDNSNNDNIMSSASLRQMLEEMDRVRGSRIAVGECDPGDNNNNNNSSNNNNEGDYLGGSKNPCRISPSPNHIALLEYIHGSSSPLSSLGVGSLSQRRVVRQLQWNAACSVDADPWYDNECLDDRCDDDQIGNSSSIRKRNTHSNAKTLKNDKSFITGGKPMSETRTKYRRRKKRNHNNNDGRYIPINSYTVTKSALPDHSPLLTNLKRRLPMRSDVGFANPTPMEVQMKMEEVRKEAEWEESSPRIVLLASGFMLVDDTAMDMDELHPSCREDVKVWAGGSWIPGLPFAGRDLIVAYNEAKAVCTIAEQDRQKQINMDKSIIIDNDRQYIPAPPQNEYMTNFHNYAKNPRSYSVFAPPVDATYSYNHTWRPRPVHDRPPGYVYFLACPVDVQVGLNDDTEPYFCTMALYTLPKSQQQPQHQQSQQSRDNMNDFCGKISEDFFFPAGNWNEIEGNGQDKGKEDTGGRQQSWRRRKRRAVMSYDPLEISPWDLYLVIQVYRAKSRPKESDQLTDVGVQLLMPICFSVTSAFCESNIQQNRVRSSFFAFADIPESNDDFIKRLICVTNNSLASSATNSTPINCGYCDLFTSYLGGDFMQALLNESPQLFGCDEHNAPLALPLLADITGDCAISYYGPTVETGKKQRSILRRLPPSQESGYASSFDLKEVLYFPPRCLPRNYDDDSAIASSTVLNLLYIYPCLIRWDPSRARNKYQTIGKYLTTRIQVVEQELPLDGKSYDNSDPTYHALPAIYNVSSPAGPPLVEFFFTKLVRNRIDRKTKVDIPLKDEVKIRLPDILDRRHFLHVSLFVVGINGGMDEVASTAIPFIISSKESVSGTRVTTIIPDGRHRLQLSEGIQIQVETRLVSSFHVSDPLIATLLRDYPLLMSDSVNASVSNSAGNHVVDASSGSSFLNIIVMASGQAVKRYFTCLVTAIMHYLLGKNCPQFDYSEHHRLISCEKTETLLAVVRSLFEILDKTRTSYEMRDPMSVQYLRLVKSFLDTFDESSGDQNPDNGISFDENHFNESQLISHDYDDNALFVGLSSSLITSKQNKRRISKITVTSPKNDMSTKSFIRKAFVATRSEQLKAEVELYDNDANNVREYFDDDETVATFGTIISRPVILQSKSFSADTQDEMILTKTSTFGTHEETDWTCGSSNKNMLSPKRSPTKRRPFSPFSFATRRAEDMANRVTSAAQLMMAQCIAPTYDISPRHSLNDTSDNDILEHNQIPANQIVRPFDPCSDVEEDTKSKSIVTKIPLGFHLMKEFDDPSDNGKSLSTSKASFIYEIVIALWVQAWTSLAASIQSDCLVLGMSSLITAWPCELIQGKYKSTIVSATAFSFVRNMAFFLPLCLKSLGMRCAMKDVSKVSVPMTLLDDTHIQLLIVVIESTALGLMRKGMCGNNRIANTDKMLASALVDSNCVMDFIIGIFACVHPTQVSILILAYFNILEDIESKTADHRQGRCVRQIKLHALERLAAMPAFTKLNFPMKVTEKITRMRMRYSSSWINQSMGIYVEEDLIRMYWDTVDSLPLSCWLSDLLINQCFSICKKSCKIIIIEAKKQSRAVKEESKKSDNVMLRCDLLRMESLAFHSILIAYELLIRRQTMDSKFQSVTSSSRVAASLTRVVLRHSLDAVFILARMDPDQRSRVTWLLSLLYILQECPDMVIRDELRKLVQDNRINDFVYLLKLAGVTCQHFISIDQSLPVLGGLLKEMAQEASNCISASVILLLDECYPFVARDGYAIEKFGGSIFDLLLHCLASPQSSVTSLRTLGACAYALELFGVYIFLKSVGSHIQHWGRIVFTLMNSIELSVRSMAVDFLVSLLCGVYEDFGSIDSLSLCFLSILPEVIAREIALFSISGLIKSMEHIECSLWPLRRSLADVEETNPDDDDRVNPQLLTSLTTFCRTAQAIIDGVLVEIRLRGSPSIDLDKIAKSQRKVTIPGVVPQFESQRGTAIFDADEESVLEASSFFMHETSLSQKIRWLFTLRDLHAAKRQWTEAAEVMIICAHYLVKSMDHLPSIIKPYRFDLWTDDRRSPWLSSIGVSNEQHNFGNMTVMKFANAFLEPIAIRDKESLCSALTSVVNSAAAAYTEEDGPENLACSQLKELLIMVNTAADHDSKRQEYLRCVRTTICSELGKFTELDDNKFLAINTSKGAQVYILVILQGRKPCRFQESTTIPTFFEWNVPSICRVSKPVLEAAARLKLNSPTESWEDCICQAFTIQLIESFRNDGTESVVVLKARRFTDAITDDDTTYISAMVAQKIGSIKSRKYFVRHSNECITEYTVAHKFPHSLSRQRSLVTSEIYMA